MYMISSSWLFFAFTLRIPTSNFSLPFILLLRSFLLRFYIASLNFYSSPIYLQSNPFITTPLYATPRL
jgi:hypothetical protein